MNSKIYTKEKQHGFITLLAMVITVAVIGGGVLIGAAGMTNIQKQGCGSSLNSWRNGDIYARLADADDSEALEQAMKCQKAVNESVKGAKIVAMGMGQTGYITGDAGEMIGTMVLNHFGDYVDRVSDPDNKSPKKDRSLPKDVKKIVKEKVEKEKEKRREEKKEEKDKGEPSGFTKTLDDIEEKIKGIDVGEERKPAVAQEKPKPIKKPKTAPIPEKQEQKKDIDNASKQNVEEDDEEICPIGFSGTSAPKLVVECSPVKKIEGPGEGFGGFEMDCVIKYSDPEGDIKYWVRREIKTEWTKKGEQVKEYDGYAQAVDFKSSNIPEAWGKCGTFIYHRSACEQYYRNAKCEVEHYLWDKEGNKSNVERRLFFDKRP